MPNNYWNDYTSMGLTPAKKAPGAGIPAGSVASMKDKPAFPSADLPGKAQGKDRSGGVRRIENSPKKIGI